MTKSLTQQIEDELIRRATARNGLVPTPGKPSAPPVANEPEVEETEDEGEGDEGDEGELNLPEPEVKEVEPEADDEGEGEDDGTAATASFSLRELAIAEGFAVDDTVDDRTLAIALLNRVKAPAAPAKAAPASDPEPEPKPVAKKPEASKPEPRVRKLPAIKKPDAEKHRWVELDPDTNLVVPIAKFGQAGEEAAAEINAYLKEQRRRADLMTEDPVTAILEDIDPEIDAKVEARLNALLAEREAKERAARQQAGVEEQDQKIHGWFQSKLSELYVVDSEGNPRRDPFNPGAYATTARGKQFLATFQELQELNPTGDPLKVLDKAYSLSGGKVAAEPVVDKSKAVVEKKKKFLSKQKKHENPVPGNKPAATIADRINSGERLSLMAALMADPSNEDNEELAKLR